MPVWARGCLGVIVGGILGGIGFSCLYAWLVPAPTGGGEFEGLGEGLLFFFFIIPFNIFLGAVIGSFISLRGRKKRSSYQVRQDSAHRAEWFHYLWFVGISLGIVSFGLIVLNAYLNSPYVNR